ncbi:MAG: AAA family ATPase, partial [Eggerthellaceae bacterium]|nr:AAA family ATPase [Eggerthellaceae bacterium]
MGISSGRIIDNAGRGALAIGVEDFETVIDNYVYVDKSRLIAELVDRPGSATLFCRPRRFGKSLALRMLQCYFEAPVEGGRVPIPDRSRLFEGLAIMGAGERYTSEMAAHPVIFLTLGEVEGSTWDEALDVIKMVVADEFARHDYLLASPTLRDSEHARFEALADGAASGGELSTSLAWLSDLLARYHGARTVILIDEYDKPVTAGHLKGFREEAVTFYRTWLTGALKATTSLYLGVMTGVQRVSRESIFSGLNNIEVDTALNHEFPEAFGFTEAEACELAGHVGKADRVADMRDWYDGYVFGGERVYNPWSLLNFLSKGGAAQPYWGNTSANAVVHDLFSQAEGATADELAALAAGGTVRERVDLATVFDMIGRDPSAIWSQLYLAGYLTTEDTAEPNNTRLKRELRVPNREVGMLYRDEFYERSEAVAGNRARLDHLHDALVEGDAPALEEALRRILLDSPSALDLVRENSYHMLLVGLTYYVYGYRFPLSNREAGDGRADVVLAPEREYVGKLPGIVVEVKQGRDLDDDALAQLAQDALA